MDVSKEVIEYKRSDGIDLSAHYIYRKDMILIEKQKLPMIMWAYPREFKDNKSASQITQNKNNLHSHIGDPLLLVN